MMLRLCFQFVSEVYEYNTRLFDNGKECMDTG